MVYADVITQVEMQQDEHEIRWLSVQPYSDTDSIYAINAENRVLVYAQDRENSALNIVQTIDKNFFSISGAQFYPTSMAISPNSEQVYVAAKFGVSGDPDFGLLFSVIQFDVNSDGTLTYHGRVLVEGDSSLVITRDGRFMYVGSDKGTITILRRNANGDIFRENKISSNFNGASFYNTQKLAISPDDKNLYASSIAEDGHLYVFEISQTTGLLKNIRNYSAKIK